MNFLRRIAKPLIRVVNVQKYLLNGFKSSLVKPNQSKPVILNGNVFIPPCDCMPKPPAPCFNPENVIILRGDNKDGKVIQCFLYNYYWPREPTTTSLYLDIVKSNHIEILTTKYAFSGDRFLAYEYLPESDEYTLIGVAAASKILPHHALDYEEWANWSDSEPDRNRMAFFSHVLEDARLFEKYKVPYFYNVDAIATTPEVAGFGVGEMLLDAILQQATDCRHAITQIIATSYYLQRICCLKKRLPLAWSVKYNDVLDIYGRRAFFVRRPHYSCEVYLNFFKGKFCD